MADREGAKDKVPLGRELEKQREQIQRRQPKDSDWKDYRPGDNLPLTEKPAPDA